MFCEGLLEFISGKPFKILNLKYMASKPIKQEDWIKHAKEEHDKIRKPFNLSSYDYSKVKYEKQRDKVTIICHEKDENGKEHGEFYPIANLHYQGKWGCKKCGKITKQIKTSISYDEVINRSHAIHDILRDSENLPRYDYSLVKPTDIINVYSEITPICPIHDKFKVTITEHLHYKVGCQKCSKIKKVQQSYKTTEQFIKDALNNPKNLKPDGTPIYDYSITEYKHSELEVSIKCPVCNKIFSVIADSHIKGQGCPDCNGFNRISKEEIELQEFIKYNCSDNKILTNNRTIIKPYELDIYIVEKGLAIEYNGLYWHSEISKTLDYKTIHLQKTEECEKRNIQLIHIFEDEWLNKRSIVESRILNLLGKNKFTIGARKCKIKQVPIEEERVFLHNNHLQGYIASTVCYGLYYYNKPNNKEYLVALMSFGPLRISTGNKSKENCYELYRFVTAKNFSIPGGASKLFKHFIKRFNPKQIISFADRRWSTNIKDNLYIKLGFKFKSISKPDYFYIKGRKRIHRFNFTKQKLKEIGCPDNMTEHKFMNSLNYFQLYDSGQLVYEYNL